jgi:hypothetical protein
LGDGSRCSELGVPGQDPAVEEGLDDGCLADDAVKLGEGVSAGELGVEGLLTEADSPTKSSTSVEGETWREAERASVSSSSGHMNSEMVISVNVSRYTSVGSKVRLTGSSSNFSDCSTR